MNLNLKSYYKILCHQLNFAILLTLLNSSCAFQFDRSTYGILKVDEKSLVESEKFVNITFNSQTEWPIYNDLKSNEKSCQKSSGCENLLGYVKHNDLVKVLPNYDQTHLTGQILDPFSNEETTVNMVKISMNGQIGYIPKSFVSDSQVMSFTELDDDTEPQSTTNQNEVKYQRLPSSETQISQEIDKITLVEEKASSTDVTENTKRKKRKIKSLVKQKKSKLSHTKKLNQAAEKIYSSVGDCVIRPAYKFPKKLPKGNAFDNLVFSKISLKKIPNVKNEKNKNITREDLINVDALARTIYGEMGICFRKGLEYPVAAARVALNRLEAKSRFKEWTGSNIKRKFASLPELTHIITTPEKFNNWKTSINGKDNSTLHHSLCPPKVLNKPYWNGPKAHQSQVAIWKSAVLIATEAVLFSRKFKSKSKSMKDINFYTSGLGTYNGYEQVFPIINGKPLNDVSCIETWKEPSSSKSFIFDDTKSDSYGAL